MFKLLASALVASMVATTMATPIANDMSANEAHIAKRALDPKAVNNALTPDQLTAQRRELILQYSEVNRLNYLFPGANTTHDGTNFTFQFINNTVRAPTGGSVQLATVNSFPGLYGSNVATGVGFIQPCGLNTPHWHPRANELLTVVQGTLLAGLILENDSGLGNFVGGPPVVSGSLPYINATLTNYTGFLFPRGLSHWQFNPNCEPAVFVAAFDSEDPGRAESAIQFFSAIPDEIIQSAVNYNGALTPADIDAIRSTSTNTAATLIRSCAQRCGIPFTKREDFEYL